MYNHFSKDKLGYKENETASPKDMLKFYTQENIDKYGVLGIEISLFESDLAFRVYNTSLLLRDFAKENLSEEGMKQVLDILDLDEKDD